MRISDWSSDVCSSDLVMIPARHVADVADIRRKRPIAPAGPAEQETTFRQPGRRREEEFLHSRLAIGQRSEEHTSELQSLMRNSYAVFCLKKTKEILPTGRVQPPAPPHNKHSHK